MWKEKRGEEKELRCIDQQKKKKKCIKLRERLMIIMHIVNR